MIIIIQFENHNNNTVTVIIIGKLINIISVNITLSQRMQSIQSTFSPHHIIVFSSLLIICI